MSNENTSINIDFSIVGNYFDVDFISNKLNITPTNSTKKGELLIGKKCLILKLHGV